MNTVEAYFKKKTKDLGFLELKKDLYIGRKKYIDKDIPLPIITDNLVKKIELGEEIEDLELNNIIEGIIFTLGADKDFPYIDDYKDILIDYVPNISDYILDHSAKNAKKGLWDIAGLWLRGLLLLEEKNTHALFNYGLVLEEIAKDFIDEGEVETGNEFINSSSNIFETILDIDEEYALSYYKLGFHYKHFEKYLKASLIWNKFIPLSKDDILTQEIREELDKIRDDAYFETGLSYLNYKDYEKALDALLKLLPKHKESWNVNYLIGQSYTGQEEYEIALKYMEEALRLNEGEAEVYNDLGIINYNLGNINEAIRIFTEGIEKCSQDYKLFFNRGLGYVNQGLYELGLKDFEKAEELNPDNFNIIKQKEAIIDALSK